MQGRRAAHTFSSLPVPCAGDDRTSNSGRDDMAVGGGDSEERSE